MPAPATQFSFVALKRSKGESLLGLICYCNSLNFFPLKLKVVVE